MSTIPNEKQARINVSANESVDSATINRSSTRLLANDLQLRDYLCNVLSTTFTDGLSGSISLVSVGPIGIRSDFLTQIDLTQVLSVFSRGQFHLIFHAHHIPFKYGPYKPSLTVLQPIGERLLNRRKFFSVQNTYCYFSFITAP